MYADVVKTEEYTTLQYNNSIYIYYNAIALFTVSLLVPTKMFIIK